MPQMGGQRPQGAPQGGAQGGRMPQMGGQRPQGAPREVLGGAQGAGPYGWNVYGDPAGLKAALNGHAQKCRQGESLPSNPRYRQYCCGMSCGGLQALHMSDDARIKPFWFRTAVISAKQASLNRMKQNRNLDPRRSNRHRHTKTEAMTSSSCQAPCRHLYAI